MHHLIWLAIVQNNCGPHPNKSCHVPLGVGDYLWIVLVGVLALVVPVIRWARKRRQPKD